MLRGPLADPGFRAQFSGHETFPLRHLWLRKAYDAANTEPDGAPRCLFTDPESIVTFGVGKNMVSSIRHWALACAAIEEFGMGYRPTSLGHFLFGEDGRDPFMERPATAWLIHWLVAGTPERTTTWFYAFNHWPGPVLEREFLAAAILEACAEHGWKRTSLTTIRRDVECFIRSYAPRIGEKLSEDAMEPVLGELGLLRPSGRRGFQFWHGPKPSLPDGVFIYALHQFWQRHSPAQNTLSIRSALYEPGSPGRVFKLDEFSLVERLTRIDEISKGHFHWSDTAAVRNVSRGAPVDDPLKLLQLAYPPAVAPSPRLARSPAA